MLSDEVLENLGFEWNEFSNGFVYPEDPNRTWCIYEGELFVRERDHYHGLTFNDVKDKDDVRKLYLMLNGSQLNH